MTIKIFDLSNEEITLNDDFADSLLRRFSTDIDPRVSSCLNCRSCVITYEPFISLIEKVRQETTDTTSVSALLDFIDGASSLHLYIWEENPCLHTLWLDPLYSEWSSATGEKRIRH